MFDPNERPSQQFDPIRAAAEENRILYSPLGQNVTMHSAPVSPLSQAFEQTAHMDVQKFPRAYDETEVHIKEEPVSPSQHPFNAQLPALQQCQPPPAGGDIPPFATPQYDFPSCNTIPSGNQPTPTDLHTTRHPPTRRYPPAPTVEDAPAAPPPSWSRIPSLTSTTTSTTLPYHPPTPVHPITFRTPLFAHLHAICTSAAATYYRSQCHSHLDAPSPTRRRYSPYNRPRRAPWHGRAQLMDYIHPICDEIWQRARRLRSHAAELEAVHRMGNLYAWGERVVGASKGVWGEAQGPRSTGTTGEARAVLLVGRDLCAALLDERGKGEVEGLSEVFW